MIVTHVLQRVHGNTKPSEAKMRRKDPGHVDSRRLGSQEFVSSTSQISPRFSDSRAGRDCSESRKKYLTGCPCETSYLPEAKHSIGHLCSLFKESSTFSHMLHFCVSFVFFNNRKYYEFNGIYIYISIRYKRNFS